VETHRLRKRLKIFYETEGKGHPVQISLPLGTYVPVFSLQAAASDSNNGAARGGDVLEQDAATASHPQENEICPPATDAVSISPMQLETAAPSSWLKRRAWLYVLMAAAVVLSVAGGVEVFHLRRDGVAGFAGDNPAQTRRVFGDASPGSAPVALPFRMIAGYAGPPQRDSAGDIWQADQYHRGGWSVHQPAFFIARTDNPLIFRYGRDGDSVYDIPLRPGTYELHLYFLQASDTNQSEDAENKNIFDVSINNSVALQHFDIVSDAMGRNIADERVFRDVSPADDGFLHLRLSTVLGTPSISAIQILKGTPHEQLPIRIVTQPSSFTDRKGQLWYPDNYFLSGRYLSHSLPANGSVAPDLLAVERYGHFSYAFPVDPRDRYTVVLYFVELYVGTGDAPASDQIARVFRVMCNGNTLLDDFDIYKEAGSYHMIQKSFFHIKPTAQGKLNLTFEPISNYATVSAIEVIDESK